MFISLLMALLLAGLACALIRGSIGIFTAVITFVCSYFYMYWGLPVLYLAQGTGVAFQ